MKIVSKILLCDASGKALVLTRGNTHPNFPGHPDLPGGEVEPGEDPAAAYEQVISFLRARLPVRLD